MAASTTSAAAWAAAGFSMPNIYMHMAKGSNLFCRQKGGAAKQVASFLFALYMLKFRKGKTAVFPLFSTTM
jgi:hypothetical protein